LAVNYQQIASSANDLFYKWAIINRSEPLPVKICVWQRLEGVLSHRSRLGKKNFSVSLKRDFATIKKSLGKR